MRDALTLSTTGTLAVIGLLHAYWALGGRLSFMAAIPSVGGVAVFTPSPAATWLVVGALFAAALVVLAAGGIIDLPVPSWTYRSAAILLAAIFALRAMGDFRLLGFFKTRGDGAFAQLDTWVYSPLCLLLAAAVATIVATRPSVP